MGQTEFGSRNMRPVREGFWIGWRGFQVFESRPDAMIEFVRLAEVVESILQTTEASPEAAAIRMVAVTSETNN